MWKRDTLILKENYSLRCTGVRSSTLNCLVTASPSTMTTSLSRVSTWDIWHPHTRVFNGCYWDCNHVALSSATNQTGTSRSRCILQVITRRKRTPSWDEGPTWTTFTCTLNSVTAFYRELENKQVFRAQRVTIQDQKTRSKWQKSLQEYIDRTLWQPKLKEWTIVPCDLCM